MATQSKPLHVILGAGQIATLLADRLLAVGFRVRLVRRGPPFAERENLSWASGDLRDRRFAEEATRGAAVVYQCSVPPYEKWLDELAALWRGGLYGASKAGARYVVLDNMYLYGRVASAPVDENTPIQPLSRKGELRARLAEEITAAHLRADVQADIGRAADFVGPGATIAVIFHEDFYWRALAGESAEVPGDPDQLHWAWVAHGKNNSTLQVAMTFEQERSYLTEVVSTISNATGQQIKGWMGPGLTETFETPRILKELGLSYVLDWCADDQPFRSIFRE
jgi:hypothetical protein